MLERVKKKDFSVKIRHNMDFSRVLWETTHSNAVRITQKFIADDADESV